MAVKLPDTLVPMADFPSAYAKDVQFTDGENLQDKLDQGKLGSSSGGTGLTEEQANNIEKIPSIEGIVTSNSQAIANKADKNHKHTEYLKEIPDEYVTDTELSSKGYATETFVTNKIAEASLSGGGTTTTTFLNGKKYCAVGDSITYGVRTTKKYHEYLKEYFNLSSVTNLGIDGSTVTSRSNGICDRLEKIPKDSDLITLFAGTNDFFFSMPLGEWYTKDNKNKRTLIKDKTTFRGALNIICEYLMDNFSNKIIYLMTPIHRHKFMAQPTDLEPNGSGIYLEEYVKCIIECGEIYSLPVIDLYSKSGLFPSNANNASLYFNPTADYLHPNATGHKKIAQVIYKEILNDMPLGSDYKPVVKTLSRISATYNQGSTKVYPTTSLDTLKTNLIVKAIYSDNSEDVVTTYNLSGTLSVGTSKITVTYSNKTTTFNVIVTAKDTSVTGVTLNKDTLTMNKIGGTQTLSYTITPSNATNKNVTWSTSVPTVASVNNGLVTANANGTTVITIRTTDGGHTDTCTVTVNDPSYIEGGGDDTLYVPDIASYGISKDGTNSEATTNGLNRLFADVNTNKKTNVQLPTGTYAINPDISLTPKSNLTLDLNNSKLKIDTNGKNGSTMIYLKEVENLTLKNGTIEGDRYDHDYSTYNENTTSHEFNVGLKIDQGSRNINIDNVKFTKITGYGLATFQGTQYCNTALDKTIMESGDYNDTGSKVADATKIRYPQAVNITEHATHGYLQVGTLLKYQNYVFNSTRTVTVRMFNASGSLLSKVTSKMYRPIAVPSDATKAYLTFHQSNPKDYLEGDMYTLDVFHMKPPRDCNITNCTFDDNRCLGIAVCGGWNIKIEGNTFKNTSKPTSDKTSPNYQHGKPGYAIDIEDGWESTQDLTINDNVFTNNGFGDIVSLAGDNTVITNNEFTGRVAMYSRNTNYVVKNNTITNGIAMWETEKDYGFTVDHNTYTDTTIKAKCYKPYDDDYYTFTNETITNCQMQLDTSITLKNSTIDLDGTTGSRFTGSYDTCTISDFDGTDANSDYNTGIKLNNCNVSKCNFFPSKDTIMTNNVFNTFRVRLDNGSLVFTGNDIQSNPKNTSMPIVQLNGGTSATIKKNTLGSAVTVDLYTNPANIPVITDDENTGEYRAVTEDDLTLINSTLTIDGNGYKLTANNKWDGARLTNVPKESKITLVQTTAGQCIWYMYKCDSNYMYVLCIGNGNGEHGKVYKMEIASSKATQDGTISMTMKPREKDILKVVVDGSSQTLYCNDTELCTLTDCNTVGISNQREANRAYIASKWEVLY